MYHKRHEDLVHFFKMERGLVASTDVHGLMQTLSINHNPLDWRLFIDSSTLSLKAVLLMMSSIPLETCWAFNEWWNNKFCYKVASCWLFLLSYEYLSWKVTVMQKWTGINWNSFKKLMSHNSMMLISKCSHKTYHHPVLNSISSFFLHR